MAHLIRDQYTFSTDRWAFGPHSCARACKLSEIWCYIGQPCPYSTVVTQSTDRDKPRHFNQIIHNLPLVLDVFVDTKSNSQSDKSIIPSANKHERDTQS